jgi:hypothetical protein
MRFKKPRDLDYIGGGMWAATPEMVDLWQKMRPLVEAHVSLVTHGSRAHCVLMVLLHSALHDAGRAKCTCITFTAAEAFPSATLLLPSLSQIALPSDARACRPNINHDFETVLVLCRLLAPGSGTCLRTWWWLPAHSPCQHLHHCHLPSPGQPHLLSLLLPHLQHNRNHQAHRNLSSSSRRGLSRHRLHQPRLKAVQWALLRKVLLQHFAGAQRRGCQVQPSCPASVCLHRCSQPRQQQLQAWLDPLHLMLAACQGRLHSQ